MESFSFSTNHVPCADRPAAWREANRRFFGDLRVEGLDDGPLDASLVAYDLGRINMYRIDAPAHSVTRDSRSELPCDGFYKLVLQLEGRARVRNRAGTFSLRAGDWTLYDPRVPYSVTGLGLSRLMVVQVPRAELRGLDVPDLHTCEASTPAMAGLYGVLAGVLRSLAEQLETLPAASAGAVSEAVLTLLRSALAHGTSGRGDPRQLPEVMKERLKQLIAQRLADPDLTLEALAQELRCSKRYLHRVFEAEGASVERYIWNARLDRCHAALLAPGARKASISGIAFEWGFNSSAHFSRLFRARYGLSPRDAQAGRAAPVLPAQTAMQTLFSAV